MYFWVPINLYTMANVKNGAFREMIIDRCLQSRRGYSTQEIMDKCNDALDMRCEPLITASNTIRNDIMSIENRWHVTVEPIRNGRIIRYRYRDPNFSIFNSPLNEEEISQLTQTIEVLQRFQGMPGFEWVDELNAHFQSAVNASVKPVVTFEENKRLKGMKFFTPLFRAITNKQALLITYHTYKDNDDRILKDIVSPYHLKQYNGRWFLFGYNDFVNDISNIPLDRIDEITRSEKTYVENLSFDFNNYFSSVIGVTLYKDKTPEEITLRVSKPLFQFILSKPIHESQNAAVQEDGTAIVTIKVIPNYEMYSKLLSFGSGLTVLSPTSIKDEIRRKIQENLKNYE